MINRPSWDDWFSSLALLTAIRSPDQRTKHGALIVNSKHQIVGVGYNGFARGLKDEEMPTDDLKYVCTIHSEINAALNAVDKIDGCTVYVTGEPCVQCLSFMINAGIKKIVVGKIKSVKGNLNNDNVQSLKEKMIKDSGIQIEYSNTDILQVFHEAIEYYKRKI